MIQTRIDLDLQDFYDAHETKTVNDKSDIQNLLNIYRQKFQLDLVFAGEMLTDNSGIVIKYASGTRQNHSYINEVYKVEDNYLGEGYDDQGLSDEGDPSLYDESKSSILHYGISLGDEYDGCVGFVDTKKKRVWTNEERAALRKLGNVLKNIIYIDRANAMVNEYEQRVRVQSQALDQFFITTDCGIMRHSLDGSKLMGINEAALKLLGYNSIEEINEDGFNFITGSVYEDDKERVINAIKGIRRVGESVGVEYRVQHRDGSILHVSSRVKLLEEKGQLVYQRLLLDQTDQREREMEEQVERENHQKEVNYALSIDYSSAYYVNLDTGKAISYRVNREVTDRIGTSVEGELDIVDGLDIYRDAMVHKDYEEEFKKVSSVENLIEQLTDNEAYFYNYLSHRETGDLYYQMRAVRMGDWSKQHTIILGFRNVDQEMRGDLEQKQLLEDALKQAEKASQAKTAFLNNMSHDIRTPMNAIMGFASLAITNTNKPDKVRDYLGKIMTSSNHLLGLINDVLDMSRIESGQMYVEQNECDLTQLMDDLMTMMSGQANANNVTLNIDLSKIKDASVICDRLRFNQVLLNVVGNAIKFTMPGGHVDVELEQLDIKTPVGRRMYELRVIDNGVGISEDFMEHIYEPFSRERTSTISGLPGTGLGLSITKNIVDMMDGTIDITSEKGKGTTIKIDFELELQKSEAEARDKAPKYTAPAKPLLNEKILVVEDHDLNSEIVAEILGERGYRVVAAINGKDAVDLVRSSRPGEIYAILMDIQMPIMDGYEATRAIRGLDDSRLARIPIIAMTANAFNEDRKRAMNAGMNAYITKPIDVPQLFETLENI